MSTTTAPSHRVDTTSNRKSLFRLAGRGSLFVWLILATMVCGGFSQSLVAAEEKEAEAKAWTDFQKLSERTQQSSRPDLLSRQQTTLAGRLILPFANTPMQMNRHGAKEILDISKGAFVLPS